MSKLQSLIVQSFCLVLITSLFIGCHANWGYRYDYSLNCQNCGKTQDSKLDVKIDTSGNMDSPISMVIKNISDSVVFIDMEKLQYYFEKDLWIVPAGEKNPLVSETFSESDASETYTSTDNLTGLTAIIFGDQISRTSGSKILTTGKTIGNPKILPIMPGMILNYQCKTHFPALARIGAKDTVKGISYLKENLINKSFSYGLVYQYANRPIWRTHLLSAKITNFKVIVPEKVEAP